MNAAFAYQAMQDIHPDRAANILVGARSAIDLLACDLERVFMGVGGRLVTAVELLGEIRTALVAATEVYSSPKLLEAETAISLLVSNMEIVSGALGSERSWITQLAALVRTLAMPIDDLRRIVSMIDAVAMNAKIVAATMIHNEETDPSQFAKEVLELARRAVQTVRALDEDRGKLEDLLAQATAASTSFATTFSESSRVQALRLSSGVETASHQRQKSVAAAGEIVDACSQHTMEIAQIVEALQIGDATRQRLEHVSTGLAAAQADPDAAQTIVTLQSWQLKATRESFEEQSAFIEQSLLHLSDRLAERFEETAIKGRKGDKSVLEDLSQSVSIATRTLADAEAEGLRVEALAYAVASNVQRLSAHADELSNLEFQMRLVSLNTAIGCSKLADDGRALSVVSLQLREFVRTMVESSEATTKQLAEIEKVGRDFLQARDQTGTNQIGALLAGADQSLAQLALVEQEARKTDLTLSDIGQRVRQNTTEATLALEGQSILADTLEKIEADVGADLELLAIDGHSASSRDALEQLRRLYTMAEERAVHQAFCDAR